MKTSGRVKETMPLDFNFTSDNRHLDLSGGGRRGRGRGSGRGNRGGRRDEISTGGFATTKEIQLENQEEFPVLGC